MKGERNIDLAIGKRAYAEVRDNFPTFAEAMRELDLPHRSILGKWKEGTSPSAMMLKKMCEHGLDIVYILTGRRSKDG